MQGMYVHVHKKFACQSFKNCTILSILYSTCTLFFYLDLPSHSEVVLPALSPTMEQGTIIQWEKGEGDRLEEGDIIAQVETDKATMDMETPSEGYLAKIIIPAGSKDLPLGKVRRERERERKEERENWKISLLSCIL